MHVVAGFQSDTFIEIAMQELIDQGVDRNKIVAIEMENQIQTGHLFDSKIHSDGVNLLDSVAAWSVVGTLFGIIWGSQVTMGPLALGLLGFIVGVLIGYLFDKGLKKRKKRKKYRNYIDVILIVRCDSKEQIRMATSIFKKCQVTSIGFHIPFLDKKSP